MDALFMAISNFWMSKHDQLLIYEYLWIIHGEYQNIHAHFMDSLRGAMDYHQISVQIARHSS